MVTKKKNKSTRNKKRAKPRLAESSKGGMGAGTLYAVVALLIIALGAVSLIGNIVPLTSTSPSTGQPVIISPQKTEKEKSNLQLFTFPGATYTPTPAEGPCGKFVIFDSILGDPSKYGYPDFASYGLVKMRGVYQQSMFDPDPSGPNGFSIQVNETKTRGVAQTYKDWSGFVFLDIEHFLVDTPDRVRTYLRILQIFSEEAPNAKVGFYGGMPPHHIYHTAVYNPATVAAWKAKHDEPFLQPLYQAIDWIISSGYTYLPDQQIWADNATLKAQEAKRLVRGRKPVYSFMNPRYVPASPLRYQYVSSDFWLFQLRTLKAAGADGVVIWREYYDWRPDDENNWWKATKQFIQEDCKGKLGTPGPGGGGYVDINYVDDGTAR